MQPRKINPQPEGIVTAAISPQMREELLAAGILREGDELPPPAATQQRAAELQRALDLEFAEMVEAKRKQLQEGDGVEEEPTDETEAARSSIAADERDVAAYLACYTAGIPFEKEYSLLDGDLRIVCRDLTTRDRRKIYAFIEKCRAAGESDDELTTRLADYLTLYLVAEVQLGTQDAVSLATLRDSAATVEEQLAHVQACSPFNKASLWEGLGLVSTNFAEVVETAQGRIFDPNF